MKHKTLYFLSYDTGDIMLGTFVKKYRKGGAEVKSRKVFTVEHPETFELSFSHLDDDVDCFFEKHEDGCIDTLFVSWAIQKYKSGDTGFKEYAVLVFSTLDKAKEICKSYVLPKLIQQKTMQVQRVQDDFTKKLSELNELEKSQREM